MPMSQPLPHFDPTGETSRPASLRRYCRRDFRLHFRSRDGLRVSKRHLASGFSSILRMHTTGASKPSNYELRDPKSYFANQKSTRPRVFRCCFPH